MPSRIAFVALSRSLGGLELTTLRLASAFHARGIAVTVVCPPDSPLAERAIARGLDRLEVKPKYRYGDPAAAWRVRREIIARGITDIVILQSKEIGLFSLSTIDLPGVRLFFYQQMQSGIHKKDLLHRMTHGRLHKWITLTEKMKAETLATTTIPERKTVVVPLGIDEIRFDPALYNAARSKRFFTRKKVPVIGLIGRLDPQKGQKEFVLAADAFFKAHGKRSALFVMIGEESRGEHGFSNEITALIESRGLQDDVRMLPFTDNVPELLAGLDILTMPSYAETYGLILLEAMAMKKPVIATAAGGVPELLRDRVEGLLIPPRDSESLFRAIDELVTKPRFRVTLGANGRKRVIENFRFESCVDRLQTILAAS